MHTYATERLNLHMRHLEEIDIRGVLARQQSATALYHDRQHTIEGDIDEEDTLSRLESTLQVARAGRGDKKNALLQQLQVVYTEEEDGTRNYIVTTLDDDKTQYADIVYVKPTCTENEQIMYR